MLEEKLQPMLTQLREKALPKEKYEITKSWFKEHEENLAENIEDLAFLCELPYEKRTFLTYPVIGNWVLHEIEQFKPKTKHQKEVYTILRELVLERRFNTPHTKEFYDEHANYTKTWDKLTSAMLSDPNDSMPLFELMKGITKKAKIINKLPQKDTYTTDLGHGLFSPIHHFTFLTFYFEILVENKQTDPLDLTIMVIDDEHPKEWYDRLISVGFKKSDKGFFYDCESALKALEKRNYDVILTDLELGEGKMDGIEFVEKAYDIQKKKGIKPMISVFSYNDKKLQEAENRFHTDEYKVFHQVNHNNKIDFTATRFRNEVSLKI